MKDHRKLYFDIWRKAYFRDLLRAYVQAFKKYSRHNIEAGLGAELDKFAHGGAGGYNSGLWGKAYSIARELGVYKDLGEKYQLSILAEDFYNSKITSQDYLANYLLNWNQMIAGQIVHPVREVFEIFNYKEYVTRQEIKSIPVFELGSASMKNAKQMVQVFCNRMMEAGLLREISGKNETQYVPDRFTLEEVLDNCLDFGGSYDEYLAMEYNEHVDILTKPNPLIYRMIEQGDIDE